jgi:DNA-binding CsgD family transcriptional regulator
MMVTALHSLFESLANAPTEPALRSRFMDGASVAFGVQRWGIYLMDADNRLISVDANGVADAFIDRYQQIGKSVDPVLRCVLQYHAPAHEELVLSPGTWKQSELYQRCCSEYDHEHIMTGPIVGNGRLIGTANFARVGNIAAFNPIDLANLSAVCSHFSCRLAELRARSAGISPLAIDAVIHTNQLLTPREIQIANLVAKGLTNNEIGGQLWITQNSVKQALKRMFRKLNVSARTEMVAKLRDLI